MAELFVDGRKLKNLRKKRNLTQGQLAIKSGVGQSHISKLESGERSSATIATLTKLARALDVYMADLVTDVAQIPQPHEPTFEEEIRSELVEIRHWLQSLGKPVESRIAEERDVYGPVPAGLPEAVPGEIVDTIGIPREHIPIRVSGDSLEGLDIRSGDIVVIDPANKEPRNGQVVVVRLRAMNEITVKRWFRENDHVRLEPANSRYKAIQARNIEVIGVVTTLIRKMA